MARGGYRPGAGRKPNPNKPKIVATKRIPDRVPAEPKPDFDMRGVDLDAIERLSLKYSRHKPRDRARSPFKIPKPPPGVIPPNTNTMAMDNAISTSVDYANESWMSGAEGFAEEGLVFLGYPYLSELAQRPEYRVIAETIADDATRKGIDFDVTGDDKEQQRKKERDPVGEDERLADPDEKKKRLKAAGKLDKVKALKDDQERLEVMRHLYDISRMDGFFGRSHLYINIGDAEGTELTTPIGDGRDNISQGKIGKDSLKSLRTVEPVWTYPQAYNSLNPLLMDWYNPQTWYVMGQQVHTDRLLTFVGHPVPDLLKPAYSFGGLSLSQMAKPYVDIWLNTRQSVAELIHSFSVMVLMTDLNTLLAPQSSANLMARVAMFNMLRDNQGAFVVNKNTEDFKNVSASLSGLHELQAQAQEHMASVSRIPLVKLTGISPSGLNASSEGEILVYDDTIAAYQNRFLRPNLSRIINFEQLSLFGEIDPEITFRFEPLREMTQAEKGQKEKDDADRDTKYVDMGALAPGEVRRRIVDDPELPYTDLDPDDVPELETEEAGGLEIPGAHPDEADDPDNDNSPASGERAAAQDGALPFGATDAEWSEGKHPRAPDGKFGSGGGGNAAKPLKSTDLKKVGAQMGSNEGGVFEDKAGGRFYVKRGQSKAHVRNERLAASLYGLAGLLTLKYLDVEGGNHIATEMTKLDKDRASKLSPAEIKAAQQSFVTHAWLSNYDAVGTGGDNLGTVNGVPTALDLGGALAYRARGAPKGEAFGNEVRELDSMRDPSISRDAAKVFGPMSADQLKSSAEHVTAIPDEAIRETVKAAGEHESMADKLIARKQDIAKRFGLIAKDEWMVAEVEEIKPDVYLAIMANDDAPFEESKHPRAPDGKFSSGGGGGGSSGSFKSKKEHIGHLLSKGTTPKEVMQAMGWPSVSMPQQAAAVGMKLEKYTEGGVTKYKGVPMTVAELTAAKEAAAAKKAGKSIKAVEPPAKAEPAAPVPKPEPPKLAFPAPTAKELEQAKKSAKLQLNYVPGEKPNGPLASVAQKVVDEFNAKYYGTNLTGNQPALIQKVNDFKLMQAGLAVLAKTEKENLAALQAEAKAKAVVEAKKAAEKAAAVAKEAAEKNKAVIEGLGISAQQAEGVVELAKMLGSSTGDIVEKFKNYEKQASNLGYPITGFQAALIKNYSNGGFGPINKALRSGAWSPAQHAYVAMVNKALMAMPKHSGEGLTRNTTLTAEQQKSYVEGMIVQENAFMSTSTGDVFSGNTTFKIKSIGKRGAAINKLSNHPGENEVLFAAKTYFKVNKVVGDPGGKKMTIHLEEWEEHV